MRKHTLVIEGGQLGAALAVAVGRKAGLRDVSYTIRRDGNAQVFGRAPEDDKGARGRWVHDCKRLGLTVAPAPWERKGAA